MPNRSGSIFITAHWCMFETNHCQLNHLMIRETLSLANLAFRGHHPIPRDGPITTPNRTCLTVTDVLITFCHSLTSISMAHQVCSKLLDWKPKLIKCYLCNYMIWLPFPKWANMTRVEKQSLYLGWRERISSLMDCSFQLLRVTRCICEELHLPSRL